MRKFVFLIVAVLAVMSACKGGKTADGEVPADSTANADTSAVDTMEQLISETPMPKAADELFDDFFFNFAANRKLQKKRIKFPLPVTNGGKTTYITKDKWTADHFFMKQGYYTLIFDNMKQMNVVKDTNINHVVVEKIYFRNKTVKQYVFDRINGQWMMQGIDYKPLNVNNNASFLTFYERFARDTAYQVKHLARTVKFTGPDPDDDFKEMTGLLTPDTWPAFAPEMPTGMVYNIIYGQNYTESNHKIFVLRGIANGLEMELTFQRLGKRWILTQLNT